MKPHFLMIATISLLWAGCRDSDPSLPSPSSTSKPTQATVTTPVSLTQVAQPQPPVSTTVAPPVSTTVAPPFSSTFTPPPPANQSNDTIFFNQTSLFQRQAFSKNVGFYGSALEVVGVSYMGIEPKLRESFLLYAPARIGRHTTAAMREPTYGLTPYFGMVNIDAVVCNYKIDQTADNWIEITAIDAAKRAVTGQFSIHLKREFPQDAVSAFEAQYPKDLHMHGSFTN